MPYIVHEFKEGDAIYFITDDYPKQRIEAGVIEFFFEHNRTIDGVTLTNQLACIRTENHTKGGWEVAKLFATPNAAKNALENALNNRRETYWTEIQSAGSPIQNIASFELSHDVTTSGYDPIAREIMLAYCKLLGLDIPEN